MSTVLDLAPPRREHYQSRDEHIRHHREYLWKALQTGAPALTVGGAVIPGKTLAQDLVESSDFGIALDDETAARLVTNAAGAEKHDALHALYLQAIANDVCAVVRRMVERAALSRELADEPHDVEQFEARR